MLSLCLTALIVAPLQESGAQARYPSLAPDALRAELAIVAGDDMQGRRTGQAGEQKAADYIQQRFEQLGLQPVDGRWQHEFPASPRWLETDACSLVLSGDPKFPDGEETFPLGDDFRPHPGAPQGNASGQVVFAGYALQALDYEYDDFDGIDLKGKVALVFRWEPGAADRKSKFEGRKLLPGSRLMAKVRECQRRGASAVLIADPPSVGTRVDAPGGAFWPSMSALYNQLQLAIEASADRKELSETNFDTTTAGDQLFMALQSDTQLASDVPVAFVSKHVVDLVFATAGIDSEKWVKEVDRSGASNSFETPLSMAISVAWQAPKVIGRNVFAVLEGSDPKLRDEIVVISAHYDHVGFRGDDIWNGADDNGSGTVTLLALAESFAKAQKKPARSIVFAAFSGEELGLVGASWMFGQTVLDDERITANVNLDMIGRSINRMVYAVGVGTGVGLKSIVERANEDLGLALDYDNDEFFHRSDQLIFYKHDVPVLFLNTDQHPDYHRPSDTFERIDYQTMSEIGVLARRVVWTLAELPTPLEFVETYNLMNPVFGRSPDLRLAPWPMRFEQRLDY